jgi:hypothetical protein
MFKCLITRACSIGSRLGCRLKINGRVSRSLEAGAKTLEAVICLEAC